MSEVCNLIHNWIDGITSDNYNDIDENFKNDIMEFRKADEVLKQKQTNGSMTKSHPQAYDTSRLLDFTEKLNEILNEENDILYNTGIQDIGNYYNILLNKRNLD